MTDFECAEVSDHLAEPFFAIAEVVDTLTLDDEGLQVLQPREAG